MQDLISFVKQHATRGREDLAGEVLALLFSEGSGQAVLRDLFKAADLTESVIEVSLRKDLDGCKPDIHLRQGQHLIGLLELKFWADFTPKQLSEEYFKQTPYIIYIVPKERVQEVRQQLSKVISNFAIRIISWDDLLGRLEGNLANQNLTSGRLFRATLDQLKEYANVLEAELPLTSFQLTTPVSNDSEPSLVAITKGLLEMFASKLLHELRPKCAAGYDGEFFYGKGFNLHTFDIWIGYWLSAWKLAPLSGPIWLQVESSKTAERLRYRVPDMATILPGHGFAFPLLAPKQTATFTVDESVSFCFGSMHILNEHLLALRGQDDSKPSVSA